MRCFFRSAILGAAIFVAVSARAVEPVADYRFENSLVSSVAGAPALAHLVDATKQIENSFTSANVDGVVRPVLHFPQFNGVSLAPTTGLISNSNYSVVILFAFEENSGYRRILDFKSGSTDGGVYTLSGNLDFYPIISGSGYPITNNHFHQVTMTRNAGGVVTGYVNGTPAFSFTDSNGDAVIDENNRLRFFQDNTGGGAPVYESSAGNVARIRVYNVALTAAEVAALDRLPGMFPSWLRLARIVGGLEVATAGDIAQWDADGDKVLTLRDVTALLRS